MNTIKASKLLNWTPNNSVKQHDGSPIRICSHFFAEPPAEIGTVLTAYSTLQYGKKPMPFPIRTSIIVGAVLLPFVASSLIVLLICWINDGFDLLAATFGSLIMGLPFVPWGLGLSLHKTGFDHWVTYVGDNGSARYRCQGRCWNLSGEILCFDEAKSLKVDVVRKFVNGFYCGTKFCGEWRSAEPDSRLLFKISGDYRDTNPILPSGSLFHFWSSAESAWTTFCFDRILEEFTRRSCVIFRLYGEDVLEVSRDCVEVCLGGQAVRIYKDELGGIALSDGQLTIRHRDAQKGLLGLGESGYWRFPYRTLENGQAFFRLLDHLWSVKCGSS